LKCSQKNQEAEINYLRQKIELNIQQSRDLAAIETKKFKEIVEAITPQVIENIAKAGPEMQAKLLGGLGLKGFLITDGNSPINLFNTASGLVGSTGGQKLGKGLETGTKINTDMDTEIKFDKSE
jgi:major vault protein